MAIYVDEEILAAGNRSLTNTLRNRLVAFGPVVVALVGIGIMAAAGIRNGGPILEANQGIDPVLTGSVVEDAAPQ